MTAVQETIKQALAKAGSHRVLAKAVGVSPGTITGWVHGVTPGSKSLERMVTYLGGNLSTALPPDPHSVMEDTEPYGQTRDTLTVHGSVSAGAVSFTEVEGQTFDSHAALWQESVYRPYTHSRPILLKVQGYSMEPTLPNGSYVVCGKPRGNPLPDLTPCIVRVNQASTLKLVRHTTFLNQPIIQLYPINDTHDIQQYRETEVEIDYIALGVITPWRTGFAKTPTPKPLLMRDSV